MPLSAVNRLGFWSGALAAVASVVFSLTALLHQVGLLELPWNPDIPDGASFVLALSFVVLMACIYQAAPAGVRIWGLVGLALAVLYAAMVTQVYMTIITVVTPAQQSGSAGSVSVAPFVFHDNGSYLSAIDGLGYFLLSLATWFAAPVFAGETQRWVRRWFIANGVVGIPVLLAYMPLVIPHPIYGLIQVLAAPWIVTLPVAAWLAAWSFRRRAVDEASAEPISRPVGTAMSGPGLPGSQASSTVAKQAYGSGRVERQAASSVSPLDKWEVRDAKDGVADGSNGGTSRVAGNEGQTRAGGRGSVPN